MKTHHVTAIDTTSTPGDEPAYHFANLAIAVSPTWHQDILRLAKASERVATQLDALPSAKTAAGYIPKARELVSALIDFLDGLEADPDLEPTLGNEFVPGSDECEIPEDAEPSLGSFDRMIDQEKSWRTCGRNPDLYG